MRSPRCPFVAFVSSRTRILRLIVLLGALSALVPVQPARAADGRVDIEVWLTPATDDDYVTWSSTPCRARVTPGSGGTADLHVVLTNDPLGPIPVGRTVPLDGDLVFDQTVAPGHTATQETLALTLPQDSSWVPFFIAGKFGRPSTQDKDAIIEVHLDSPSGMVIDHHALMVRVRKMADTLTPDERDRYLWAVRDLRDRGDYRRLTDVHFHAVEAAFLPAGNPQSVPDQAHGASAFTAWHRAFLLRFERLLQERHPDVSLPYWQMGEPTTIFVPDFAGSNPVVPFVAPVLVEFAVGHPWWGWKYDGLPMGMSGQELKRFGDRSETAPPYAKENDVIVPDAYGSMRPILETNPHGTGHVRTGPWMRSCRTSPQDPLFWIFHCDVDRIWAKWQWKRNRFGTTGTDPKIYAPTGQFTAGDPVPWGHHLKDTMWPWDQTSWVMDSDRNHRRPVGSPPDGKFPAARIAGLWPAAEATPRPADVVDYLGIEDRSHELGFCYDDVPFGAEPVISPMAAPEEARSGDRLKDLTNRRLSLEARLEAGRDLSRVPGRQTVEALARVLRDRKDADAVRELALDRLFQMPHPAGIGSALKILAQPGNGGPELRTACVESLFASIHFGGLGRGRQPEIIAALRTALDDPHEGVRLSALYLLASMDDSVTVERLRQSLERGGAVGFSKLDAVRALASAGDSHVGVVRRYLGDPDPAVRVAAISGLYGDPVSRGRVVTRLLDPREVVAVRSAALRELMDTDTEFPSYAFSLLETETPVELQAEVVAGLGVYASRKGKELPAEQLRDLVRRLEALRTADRPYLRKSLATAVRSAAGAMERRER